MEQQPSSSSQPEPISGGSRKRLWVIIVSGAAIAAAIVVAVWVPADFKCLPCAYDPSFQTCFGISRQNPAVKEECYYKKEPPCIMGIAGAKPRQCFGILR